MENDSIRPNGTNTLVDIWIDGKLRAITVSQEAIGGFLGFDRMAGMSDNDRCEFVRTHLPLVLAAAKTRLRDTNPAAGAVIIDAGQLPQGDGRIAERRKAERRKNDKLRGDQPERRRGDRRKGQRQTRSVNPKEN